MSALRGLAQLAFWAVCAALVVGFAHWPRYQPLPDGHGELKLSMAHLTQRLKPCRQLSAEERAQLPPNMRAMQTCERERSPARIELLLDDAPLFQGEISPAGLHRDGRSYLHRTWALPAGHYRLLVRLRDTPREEGYDLLQPFELDLRQGASALLRVADGGASLDPGGAGQTTPQSDTP